MNQFARISSLAAGQVLRGKCGCLYSLVEQTRSDRPNVWRAQANGQVGKDVIVKAARPDLFENEVRTLENFRGHRSFRQLVDVIQDQPMLVLEYLDTNIQHVVNQRPKRRLEDLEVKFVAKVMLEGLDRMHELKMVHTDIKPDNILVDSDYGFTSLSNTKLCDLGDSAHLDSPKDHVIGAAVYRAPEANFGLPWTTAVDIWSFGATLMYLLSTVHFFSPHKIDESNETYLAHVIKRQFGFFGPCPDKYAETASSIMPQVGAIQEAISKVGGEKVYRNALTRCINGKDVEFLLSFMKIDPRDRPSAKEILQNSWFDDTRSRDFPFRSHQ